MVLVSGRDHVSYYNVQKYNSFPQLHHMGQIHGAKRVVAFFLLCAVMPALLIITPLYLRHSVYAATTHPVAESDVLVMSEGLSSVFCQGLSLHMNTSTFNAFQIVGEPKLSAKRKHIRLKKSMTLPDDTLEYWGFFLLTGALVRLKVCSRHEGSRILVVKGEKNLRTCGLLQHNANKLGDVAVDAENAAKVKVTFETAAEEVQAPGIRRRRELNELDAHTIHGGTNKRNASAESSESSFETDLLRCYQGKILLSQGFPPSATCTNVHELMRSEHMVAEHEVTSDGYYYYIFYSDNDIVENDIHAVFDIHKPSYHFGPNGTSNQDQSHCLNATTCHFPIEFWSSDTVIVEVPTRDGIEHEEDDITILTSRCEPRVAIYLIFPISVLFLILGCAFL